jgi:hypothetical protein
VSGEARHIVRTALAPAATAGLIWWLALALLHLPEGFDNVWGFFQAGRDYSIITWISTPARWPEGMVAGRLQSAFALLWVAWAVTVASSHVAEVRLETAAMIAAALAAGTTLLVPPMLSGDVFGYVAYGRVSGLYGLDPYVSGREALTQAGDPAAAFVVWSTPFPYGPLWAMVAGTIAWLGQSAGLWLEVFLHKALAALALVTGALLGARIAAPARRGAVALAIALNPLLLVESAGSGHNDALMMAFVMWAAVLGSRSSHMTAAFALGLAVSVKPVALAALPIMLAARWFDGARWTALAAMILVALAPPLTLLALVGDIRTFAVAVILRVTTGQTQPAWLVTSVMGVILVVAIALLARPPETSGPRDWLLPWSVLAVPLAIIAAPVPFPWYITWALMPVLTKFDRTGMPYLAGAITAAIVQTWQYTVAR